jgi:hypothetical protein
MLLLNVLAHFDSFQMTNFFNSQLTVPRSCYHLKKMDVRKSGKYLIDPDGPHHGEPSFEALCDMKTGKHIEH